MLAAKVALISLNEGNLCVGITGSRAANQRISQGRHLHIGQRRDLHIVGQSWQNRGKCKMLRKRLIPGQVDRSFCGLPRLISGRLRQQFHAVDSSSASINEELSVKGNAVLPGTVRNVGLISISPLLGRKEHSPLQCQMPAALVRVGEHHSTFGLRFVRHRCTTSILDDGI